MKPNLDNVFYRLKDAGEIKLCVLFCLRYADEPLSDSDLKHIMLSATSVDFLELCGIIDTLIPDNFVKKVWRNETEMYTLTEQGQNAIDEFNDKIMASVRASLKSAIDKRLNRKGPKTQVKCVVTPAEKDLYNVDAEITEGKKTLLKMTVFTGSKEKSASYARGFRKNPMGFYTEVINTLSQLAEDAEKEE